VNLRILDIKDGVVTYKVDGVTRKADIPKGTRDITAHLLKLEGVAVPPDKLARAPAKRRRTKEEQED
jgi:hypothetical protein